MTKKQRLDHIQNITDTLVDNGWELDRWGNYKKTLGNIYRVKMQKTSLRIEVKVGSRWSKKISGYFKDIEPMDKGLKFKGKPYSI